MQLFRQEAVSIQPPNTHTQPLKSPLHVNNTGRRARNVHLHPTEDKKTEVPGLSRLSIS